MFSTRFINRKSDDSDVMILVAVGLIAIFLTDQNKSTKNRNFIKMYKKKCSSIF